MIIDLGKLIEKGITSINRDFFTETNSVSELHIIQKSNMDIPFSIDSNLIENLINLKVLSLNFLSLEDGDISFIQNNDNLENLQILSDFRKHELQINLDQNLPSKITNLYLRLHSRNEYEPLMDRINKKLVEEFRLSYSNNFSIQPYLDFENIRVLNLSGCGSLIDFEKLELLQNKNLVSLSLSELDEYNENDPKHVDGQIPNSGFPDVKLHLPNLKVLYFPLDRDYFPENFISDCPKLEYLNVFHHDLASYSVELDLQVLDHPSLKYLKIPDFTYLPKPENLERIVNHPRVKSGEVMLSEVEEGVVQEAPEELEKMYQQLLTPVFRDFY